MQRSRPQSILQAVLIVAIGSTAVPLFLEHFYGPRPEFLVLGPALAICGGSIAALLIWRGKT
ncbi:MAG: hypothetical protein J0I79_34665 [Mesorhizobium sp.]|uniref:hypothetical protein n=1 Tax=Mesorhizobium sp. TaxID=1871066 RepID=UPI001AD1BC3E|nr:hypothetical protein [Mesorhizobium sp.]MBN9223098.1 hypothetical protein [Mesorhizobium sp.]